MFIIIYGLSLGGLLHSGAELPRGEISHYVQWGHRESMAVVEGGQISQQIHLSLPPFPLFLFLPSESDTIPPFADLVLLIEGPKFVFETFVYLRHS